MADIFFVPLILVAEDFAIDCKERGGIVAQRILKAYSSGEFHYVFGEVYAPDIVDTDGESMSASDIQKMAHDFLARGMVRALDVNHDRQSSGAVVVESFIVSLWEG